MGARRPVAEVQVTVIVVMMVVAVIVAMFMVVMMGVVRLAVAFQPRALTLTASAYRAHRFTSESVNESPVVARRVLGVSGKARGCTKERA